MSTDAEKFEQIAALCDEMGSGFPYVRVADLRAVLAEPGPAVPPEAIDRDALIRELDLIPGLSDGPFREGIVERILALVRPVEDTFTRDRVRAELLASLPADPKWATWVDGVLDRLELPGGVTLSREDASLAAYFVRDHIGTGWADPIWPTDDHLRALVARLEGASS